MKKNNLVGTSPNSNIKIVERSQIYTPNTSSLFWLDTGICDKYVNKYI